LSIKLRKILQYEAKDVFVSDEYIEDPSFVTAFEVIKRSDIVVIGAPHKRYKNLNYKKVHLVDIWNMTQKGGYFL